MPADSSPLAVRSAASARSDPLVISRPLARVPDLLAVFAAAPGPERFFWEAALRRQGLVAWGAVETFTAEGPLRFRTVAAAARALAADLRCGPNGGLRLPVIVGAFAFDDRTDGNGLWGGFPAARFVVPRVVVWRRGDRAGWCALVPRGASDDLEALERWVEAATRVRPIVAGAPAWPVAAPSASYRLEADPSPARWLAQVRDGLAAIGAGRLRKVVLARRVIVTASGPIEIVPALARLREAFPACTVFAVSTAAGTFLGASPERLVELRRRRLRTEAVAGSRGVPIGMPGLGARLRGSAKDRREHAFVVSALTRALRGQARRLRVGATRVRRFADLEHLVTPISGASAEGVTVVDLAGALHPSPAVGGAPRAAALEAIARTEGRRRGWYAGPVGWMDGNGEGAFVVGIRSALVRGGEAVLFAGAGIVAGSTPEGELAETQLKFQPLLRALLAV